MLCRRPFVKAGVAHACGQCMPCRFARRKMWAHRIMLENLCHKHSSFVTLTYGDDKLVLRDSVPILVPDHLQSWLKRFRFAVDPVRIRFYAVGEYGDRGGRPHYHVIVFGFPCCLNVVTRPVFGSSRPDWKNCCSNCRIVGDTWGFGDIFVGSVTHMSAGYVAEYTVKKMTAVDDLRLKGRTPEFCRMSLRPGIGADAMWDVASDMMKYGLDVSAVDVPTALVNSRKHLPLGRYLRDRLRVNIGREKGAPDEVSAKMAAELQPVRDFAFNNSVSFAKVVSELDDGRVAALEARNEIYKRKEKL